MNMTPQERKELIADITEAMMSASHPPPSLSDDELHWVRLAIKKEAQSVALRQAIIEKTFTGLVWGVILFLFAAIVEWAKSHGFKP